MSSLVIEIPAISEMAMEIMKRIIDENEKTQKITDEQSGPIPVASAMSDFFQLASAIENGAQLEDASAISELADYALDLVDRVQAMLWYLDIHDQRDRLSRLFVSLAAWFARQDAVIGNLKGAADSFAILVNGENDSAELADMSRLMDEVLDAASSDISRDEDRSDQFRPWRVLNLNAGVAATRSFDAALMGDIFEKMEQRLPHELPGFFSDGRRQVQMQDVPDDVREVMTRFADKWADKLSGPATH